MKYRVHGYFSCLNTQSCIKRPFCTGCRPWGCQGLPWHPQILADQLTLSQPGGTDYAPHIFRPSYDPGALRFENPIFSLYLMVTYILKLRPFSFLPLYNCETKLDLFQIFYLMNHRNNDSCALLRVVERVLLYCCTIIRP